jgi:MFS family permease
MNWEARTEYPMLNVRAFRGNIPFIFSNLAALINYSATYSVTFLLSLYLQYIKALNPQQAGMVLMAQPVMMAIFSPIAGRLSDKIEPRVVASIGMSLTTAGLAAFIFLAKGTHDLHIIVSLVVLGIGFGLFSSPNTNAVMSSVDKKFYGVASASVGTMRLVGQMLSMGISTMLFEILIGHVQITPPHYPEFLSAVRIGFTISTALCFVGIFISLARGKVRQ